MFGHDNDKDDHQNTTADETTKTDDGSANDWQHPGTPLSDGDDSAAPDTTHDDKPIETEAKDEDSHVSPSVLPDVSETPANSGGHSADDLIDLKQQALTKLSPLVDHLDQSPDDKFRTLMMMIQASDDQSLVKEAYAAALKIGDEKERAQALLDIVNEINYFTQNPSK